MLDCIANKGIRDNPQEKIDEFFAQHKEQLDAMTDIQALYIALDQFCKKHSLNYATVENCLRKVIEPALDRHIFSA